MARGGARPNSGRKQGAVTVRSRAEADAIAKEPGISMLRIMVDNARYFHKQSRDAEAALAKLKPTDIVGMDPEDQFAFVMAKVKEAAGLRQMADKSASNAAPFLHARIASVEHSGPDGGDIPLGASAPPPAEQVRDELREIFGDMVPGPAAKKPAKRRSVVRKKPR